MLSLVLFINLPTQTLITLLSVLIIHQIKLQMRTLHGDFNIDILITDSHHHTKEFIHAMYTHAFYPTISKHTRVTAQSATIIDNLITNVTFHPIKSGLLFSNISDHYTVFNLYSLKIEKDKKKHKCIFKRDIIRSSIHKINLELQEANWQEVCTDENPCTSYNNSIAIVTSLIDKCLPLKKLKVKSKSSQWLTKGIMVSCKHKSELYKTFKNKPTTQNEKIYKKFKHKYSHVIRLSKKLYFQKKRFI